jgi:hypothetical protein
MRLFIRKGRSSQPVYVGSSQQFVDSEDYMFAMTKYVKPCGSVHNMYIDFENTNIPVTNVSEIRVLSQMAAAYHNACLAQNLQGERDLYGMPYDTGKWPEIVSDKNEIEGNKPIEKVSKDTSKPTLTKNNVTKAKIIKSTSNLSSRAFGSSSAKQGKKSKEKEWDEELQGDRIVFDSTFEMNEHLVPWLMDPDSWEEKYGMY